MRFGQPLQALSVGDGLTGMRRLVSAPPEPAEDHRRHGLHGLPEPSLTNIIVYTRGVHLPWQ
jgi:hypothetical protein